MSLPVPPSMVILANARLPSQRAQSVQVLQVAAAFARAGVDTTLLHARRTPTPGLPPGEDLFSHYGIAPGPRPTVEAVPCTDWIDRVPRSWQYLPARIQELSFARNAARRVEREHPRAWVLAREAEAARSLGSARLFFLEVHRVPGGRLRRRWTLEAARAARGVVAISEGVAEDLVELGVPREAIRVEHDGYDPALLERAPDRRAARGELGLEPEAAVVVYTGGLLAWKGVELLVDAARAIPGAQFVVAGGMDADVERLRARAAGLSHVRFDGFQPPARIGTYLRAADVAVVPNRSQPAISARYTSPLKVFEAMAAGVALVASDLPSLRALLDHGEDALLVKPDDAEALGAGIRRLLEDEALRAKLGGRLAARSAEHSWDARARRLLQWMGERSGGAA